LDGAVGSGELIAIVSFVNPSHEQDAAVGIDAHDSEQPLTLQAASCETHSGEEVQQQDWRGNGWQPEAQLRALEIAEQQI
jgi:hypothetical protein